MDKNIFCEQLKNFFVSRGLSQRQLAESLETSQPYVARLLNGQSNFGRKQAARFQSLYGLNASWLLTGEGPMMAADVQTGNSVSVVTHGDNSPAAGGNQRITTEGANEDREFRDEVKSGLKALESGVTDLKTEISTLKNGFEALKTEISALRDEKGRLLSIIENLTGGANK